MKKFLILISVFFGIESFAAGEQATVATKFPLNALEFQYQTFDLSVNLKCSHEKENEWYDWKVVCGENGEKEFSVHLALSKYSRSSIPKTRYEVLYWITDRTDQNKGTGTTVWFHMNEETTLNKIQLRQSTDNDLAGLYLTITPY